MNGLQDIIVVVAVLVAAAYLVISAMKRGGASCGRCGCGSAGDRNDDRLGSRKELITLGVKGSAERDRDAAIHPSAGETAR